MEININLGLILKVNKTNNLKNRKINIYIEYKYITAFNQLCLKVINVDNTE